jgi:superfamily II DNA or RNA helicase
MDELSSLASPDKHSGGYEMNPLDILRGYQREALDALWKSWDAGGTRVSIVMATGLGKTKVFTRAVWKWLQEKREDSSFKANTGKRVLVIAHTDELIEQAAREMCLACPGYSVGIVKANLNETHARIIISSRQTLASERRRAQIRNVGLIVVDECHHALRTNTYGKILEHFGAFCMEYSDGTCTEHHGNVHANPGAQVKVLGVTATLARGDKGKLSTVWETVAFKRDILFGIRNGFLLDVRGERVIVADFDLGKVKQSGGDYQESALADELERTFAPQKIAEKYASVARVVGGNALRQGIAFWPLVDTAYHGAEAFEAAGIPSAVIHGGLPKEERKLILKRFRAGEITVVHNCMVLTEGFDAPWADVVVIARPTRSAPLYQQMVGRVLRPDLNVPAAAREKALILDVTGAGATNDLRSLIDLAPERPLKRDEDMDDMSLLELDDALFEFEEINSGGSVELPGPAAYDGETATIAFDPLHRESLWARTPEGIPYMTAGSAGFVFLFEREPDAYDIVFCTKVDYRTPPQQAKRLEVVGGEAGLTLEDALMYGEEYAFEAGGHGAKTLAKRTASWRKDEPSDGLKRKGQVLRVWKDGMTKGELAEAISAKIAANSIDPLVRTVRASMKG